MSYYSNSSSIVLHWNPPVTPNVTFRLSVYNITDVENYTSHLLDYYMLINNEFIFAVASPSSFHVYEFTVTAVSGNLTGPPSAPIRASFNSGM